MAEKSQAKRAVIIDTLHSVFDHLSDLTDVVGTQVRQFLAISHCPRLARSD